MHSLLRWFVMTASIPWIIYRMHALVGNAAWVGVAWLVFSHDAVTVFNAHAALAWFHAHGHAPEHFRDFDPSVDDAHVQPSDLAREVAAANARAQAAKAAAEAAARAAAKAADGGGDSSSIAVPSGGGAAHDVAEAAAVGGGRWREGRPGGRRAVP